MADVNNPSAREAKRGDKTIEIGVRLWTDNISDEPGEILKKHAWTKGYVRVHKNESHEIDAGEELMFQSLLDLGSAIEKALLQSKIVLHPSNRMDRYLRESPPHNRPKRRSN